MAATKLSSDKSYRRWQLDGNDQWTDELEFAGHFRGAFLNSFTVTVEGTFTGQPVIQIKPEGGSSWVTADDTTFTPDEAGVFNGEIAGKFSLRAGFVTLTGTAIVTVQR